MEASDEASWSGWAAVALWAYESCRAFLRWNTVRANTARHQRTHHEHACSDHDLHLEYLVPHGEGLYGLPEVVLTYHGSAYHGSTHHGMALLPTALLTMAWLYLPRLCWPGAAW